MKKNLLTVAVSFAATFALMVVAGTVTAGPAVDSDADGVQDGLDNCRDDANSGQEDADLDGRGQECDSDLTNDGITGIPDFSLWLPSFGLSEGTPGFSAIADMTADGVVGIPDFSLWLPDFGLMLDPATARAVAPSPPVLNTSAP